MVWTCEEERSELCGKTHLGNGTSGKATESDMKDIGATELAGGRDAKDRQRWKKFVSAAATKWEQQEEKEEEESLPR